MSVSTPQTTVDEQFRDFVREHGAALTRMARLLTGDHHHGEDLTQNVLTKLYLRWAKIDEPLAYARTALVSTHIDTYRRRWWSSERPNGDVPDQPAGVDTEKNTADQDQVQRLLRELTPRERAVIVLRYQCDLSEQETARTLGMAVGTVKSTCARALTRLRVTTKEE